MYIWFCALWITCTWAMPFIESTTAFLSNLKFQDETLVTATVTSEWDGDVFVSVPCPNTGMQSKNAQTYHCIIVITNRCTDGFLHR